MSRSSKLIDEIEQYGKELFSYGVSEDIFNDKEGEPCYEVINAGEAVVYSYAGEKYEITTWNENSQVHDEGDKTLKVIK